MSAWSGGRVLLLETNVEVQAHRPPLRKSSESESGPVLNEITGSDPVIYIYLSDPIRPRYPPYPPRYPIPTIPTGLRIIKVSLPRESALASSKASVLCLSERPNYY